MFSLSDFYNISGVIVPPTITVFETDGVWTPNPKTKIAIIEAVGGGGSGGSWNTQTPANTLRISSGGNSGDYLKILLTASDLDASHNVVVGVGGLGMLTAISTAGTLTSVSNILIAAGGQPGSTVSVAYNTHGEAACPMPSTEFPMTFMRGKMLAGVRNAGGASFASASYGGVGTPSVAGFTGMGGSTPLGSGGKSAAVQNTGGAIGSRGHTGTGYGSGGSGAITLTTSSPSVASSNGGGDGTNGIVIITEFV